MDNNNNEAEQGPSTSRALPTMPAKGKYKRVVVYDSSSNAANSSSEEEEKSDTDTEEESTEEAAIRAEIGREIERLREQTPALTEPIGCSTGRADNPPQPDIQGTPIHRQETLNFGNEIAEPEEAATCKIRAEQNSYSENNQIKSESEPRRSERIKSARRVVKLGGVESF